MKFQFHLIQSIKMNKIRHEVSVIGFGYHHIYLAYVHCNNWRLITQNIV